MQTDREHRLRDNLGRTFLYTRWPQFEEDRQLRKEAVIRYKVFAQQHFQVIAESGTDPFHYGLLDLWLDLYREPWAQPRTLAKLVDDLAEKIASGELRVYLEDSLMWRHVSSGGSNGASGPGVVTHGPEESDKPRSQGAPYIPHPDDRYTLQSDGKPMGVVEGAMPTRSDVAEGTKLSGKNPPINQNRQKLHTDGTEGKSQFKDSVDADNLVQDAWRNGTPKFNKNGKLIGKVKQYKGEVGTQGQTSVDTRFSRKHGVHGFPSNKTE